MIENARGGQDQKRGTTLTQALGWLPYLDGWRGLSVLAVLLSHFFPIPIINTGRLGVEMFFCLSGRLMAQLLYVEKRPIGDFLFRRVSRVWPALYVFVFCMYFVFASSQILTLGPIDILAALSFTSNYSSIYFHDAPVIDHLWSLAIEEWSYLFLALVAFLSRRFKKDALFFLLAAAMICVINGIWQSSIGKDYYSVYWRTDVRLSSILIPTIAYIFLRGQKVQRLVPIVFIFLGVALSINRVPDPIKYTLGTACLSIGLATIESAAPWLLRVLSWTVLRWIGLISFSLYLWQQPFAKIEGSNPVYLFAVFACAICSFYLIERPMRKKLNALLIYKPGH